MENVTLRQLIKVAYDLRSDSQVVDGPEWIAKTHIDINARMDDEEFTRMDKMSEMNQRNESQLLLQRLLVDRFGLRVRRETRPLPQFALVIDGAAKLGVPPTEGGDHGANLSVHNGQLTATYAPMEELVSVLSDSPEVGGRVVTDHTGLTGAYNFELNWAPDRSGAGVAPDATLPGLFTALKDQLGLKLERGVGDVPVVVVEQATLPQFD
jgi:uncharacterized protein (TIGR03435 family)